MNTTTTTHRQVRTATRRTGTNFGWVGEVRALNNRAIATTAVYPTAGNAAEAAAKLAAANGWVAA